MTEAPPPAEGRPPGGHAATRLQELFEALLSCPVEDRPALLERMAIDSGLEAEALALVAAHESEGPFDEIAAALAAIGTEEPDAAPAHEVEHVGPYRVEEVIGSGGMATVYRGRRADSDESPWVALKILRPDADSARVRRRFMAERQILAGLDHPGIARLVDDGLTSDGFPYLVTELVDGEPLDRHCDRYHLDSLGRLRLLLDVCRVVDYAHRRGLVHRDLKPDNVLVTVDGEVRLLDFGIAKILDRERFPGVGRAKTTTGVHLVTLGYASPEQIAGEDITPASDVYQLGLLLVKLLIGRIPPMHDRTRETRDLLELSSERARGLRHLREHRLLAALEPVARKALRRAPRDRHPTALALAEDLEEAVDCGGSRPSVAVLTLLVAILAGLVAAVLLLG